MSRRRSQQPLPGAFRRGMLSGEEQFLLSVIMDECRKCITSEGLDCFQTRAQTRCPLRQARERYGIQSRDDIGLL